MLNNFEICWHYATMLFNLYAYICHVHVPAVFHVRSSYFIQITNGRSCDGMRFRIRWKIVVLFNKAKLSWIECRSFTECEILYHCMNQYHSPFVLYNPSKVKFNRIDKNIIQILTGTVMKYHISVDCQESIFSQGKYCPEGKYNYLGTTNTWYFIHSGRYLLWSKWMNSSKFNVLYDYHEVW